MKKIFSVVLVAAVLFLTGCFKDNTINNGPGSFNTANGGIKGDYIQFTYSGLEYFGNSTLLLAGVTSPVTIPIIVNLASVKPLTQDLNVAIAVNDAARTDYNSTSAVQYVAMPDSDYTISSLAGTIKAGQRLDTFLITFDPNKIDPTQNYMLPITLQAANGVTLSGNFNTYYFHTIGNPLAGNYTWNFTRYNNNDGSGSPAGGTFTDGQVTFLPDDPTTVEMTSGYYVATERYVLSFDNNGGVLSNFSLAFNPNDVANIFTANGISVTNGPNIVLADAVNKHFIFQYTVFNGSAYRYLIDEYIKQ